MIMITLVDLILLTSKMRERKPIRIASRYLTQENMNDDN